MMMAKKIKAVGVEIADDSVVNHNNIKILNLDD
jgi:hypothetical protein